MNNTMKAIVVGTKGPELRKVPLPNRPAPEQVLVKVNACGVNRADLLVLSGQGYGASGGEGTVIGIEWAGEIAAIGSAVPASAGFSLGDAVMGLGGAALAEFTLADWGRVCRLPAGTDFVEAATLPLALATMHDAIVTNGRLSEGQSILISGASSAVGMAGVQIARLLGAAFIVGTTTNAERRAKLKSSGVDLAIDSTDPSWPDLVLAETAGRGVDLVVDMVSGSNVDACMRATAVKGRIINVGRLSSEKTFDFELHALRRITYIGVTFRTRTIEEARFVNRLMYKDLWSYVAKGAIRIPVSRVFSIDDAADAFQLMERNGHFGKIVVTI